MQNSGLGVSVNALGSLHQLYRMPVLLLVTWRGYQGKDAPEHLVMGRILPDLLDLLEIPWRVPDAASLERDVDWAAEGLRQTAAPVALVVKPGLFHDHH
jgi:sulfopyruvate decarboxylase TPP-binding subunit